jgi:hypothetical protein
MTRLLSLALLTLSLIVLATEAHAQYKAPSIAELGWGDKRHIKTQRLTIDDIARTQLGTEVHGDKSDLVLLQRIIHKGLIKKSQRLELQAMGVVLAEVLQNELGLVWQIYEDSVGRSRALCVAGTLDCLYPMTMLSRRIEVGLVPNVQEIYDYAVATITPFIPKTDVYGEKPKVKAF